MVAYAQSPRQATTIHNTEHRTLGNPEVTLRFINNPTCSSSVVTLGDLIEIESGSSSAILRSLDIVLGPAPLVDSGLQTWYSSDVLQHLELRGIHPASIAWSGPDRVGLQRTNKKMVSVADQMSPAYLSERMVNQAHENVAYAIAQYINYRTGETTDWRIQVKVDERMIRQLQSRNSIVSVGGGTENYTGKQDFVLQIKTSSDQGAQIRVQAIVELPEMVIVASRPLRRDEILTADALKFKVLDKSVKVNDKVFTDFTQVIGKQMRRTLSTGLPITESTIGDPIVISRAQIVTVECVSGGITVSTPGKSMGAGAVGELIEVELPGRNRIFGTVIGPMVVRVAAKATPARN